MNLRTTKQSDGMWWILDVPAYQADGATWTSCGPYATRDEADDIRRGLERFYQDNPEFQKEQQQWEERHDSRCRKQWNNSPICNQPKLFG